MVKVKTENVIDWRESFVDSSPDFVARFNRQYQHIYINHAIEIETGLSASEIVGKTNAEIGFSDEKEVKLWEEKIESVFVTAETQDHYAFHKYPDHTKYYFTKFIPVFSNFGAGVESVVALTRDITEFKNIENKLKRSKKILKRKNDELKRINEHLDNFVHIVAHDLKGPVYNLKISSKLLNEATPEEAPTFMKFIEEAINRMEQTVNSMVELVSIENQNDIARKISVPKLVTSVLEEYRDAVKSGNVEITTNYEISEIRYIEGFLSSILTNLISNSFKYSRANEILQLKISLRKEEGFVVLEVSDNGTGIDLQKNAEKIFKPFTRLTSVGYGKGIGLNIIKTMIAKNGGRIQVQSSLGTGTTFTCYLKEYSDIPS